MLEVTYTDPAEATELLAERLANKKLVSDVTRYLGDELPDSRLLDGPAFVLGDYVARGRGLDVAYAKQARKAGATPFWATYDDRYSRTNPAKASTVRPTILLPDGTLLSDMRIDQSGDPRGMMSRSTIFGSTLTEYHKGLREAVLATAGLESVLPNVFDMTEWYRTQAKRFGYQEGDSLARAYMVPRTALGVLCAQSVDYQDRHYQSGFMDVVLPAIQRVQEEVGVEPLFVRRPWSSLEDVISLRGIPMTRVQLEPRGRGKRQQQAVRGVLPSDEVS